jgi:hypothetical protein
MVAGIAFNWSWLVAAGIAPILLAVLPCAVMCGLGLCMNRLFSGGAHTTHAQSHDAASRSADPPVAPSGSAANADGAVCCQGSADATAEQRQPQKERSEPHA